MNKENRDTHLHIIILQKDQNTMNAQKPPRKKKSWFRNQKFWDKNWTNYQEGKPFPPDSLTTLNKIIWKDYKGSRIKRKESMSHLSKTTHPRSKITTKMTKTIININNSILLNPNNITTNMNASPDIRNQNNKTSNIIPNRSNIKEV